MGFAINTNNDALNTYRNLTNVQNSLSKSLERLSSGLRINQAGDDAAGLTIATQIGSQVSGLQQAGRNAQDGVSLVQTADGGLSQAQSLLGRLRDLAVQAANDSNSTEARNAITTEATSITDELTRLGNSVSFNGIKLLNGSANLTFQVGANGDSASQVGVNLSTINLGTIATALNATPNATFAVTPASLAAGDYTFKSGSTSVKVTAASADVASASAFRDKLNSSADFASHFSASLDGSNNLVVTSKTGVAIDTASPGAGLGTGSTGSVATSYMTSTGAQAAITLINQKITDLSTARANIGALENRFSNALSTISTTVQNLTAAKSRITDVDMASEMVNYTRANVLSQSGTAMLAQANSLPQLALKLLS